MLKISLSADANFLPRYIFAYYSGESDRLYQVFRPYLEDFDKKLRCGEDPGLKRLFYAMPKQAADKAGAKLVTPNCCRAQPTCT